MDKVRFPSDLLAQPSRIPQRIIAGQLGEMDRFLAEFRDPESSHYHKWIGPESYADRFGLSLTDTGKIVEWRTAQHLTTPQWFPKRTRAEGTGVRGV